MANSRGGNMMIGTSNIGRGFLDEAGTLPGEIMLDGLHPSANGYEIWAKAVKQPLEELIRNR